VEQLVTFPIETALNGTTDVRRVRSSSTTGFSVVWVEFDWDTDIYVDRQIVSEKLATIKDELPANVGTPTLAPQSSILGEMMIIGLTSDSTSPRDLRTLADWTIRPRLLSIEGVAQVAVLGGEIKEYQVLLHPGKMMHYGVGLNEVIEATEGMNQNVTGGVLYEYGNEYIVRGILSTNSTEQLGKTVVKMEGDYPILLEHIAEVTIGNRAPKLGVAANNTQPAVLLTVTKQPAINTMSLGGLAISIGSLVDDAIVDVENVYKRIWENRLKPVEKRESTLSVVYDASKEVRMPIFNSTLIIIASFVPLFFLSGMEGPWPRSSSSRFPRSKPRDARPGVPNWTSTRWASTSRRSKHPSPWANGRRRR
jgi:Cu/Ag efflux pump CusA